MLTKVAGKRKKSIFATLRESRKRLAEQGQYVEELWV